MSHPNLCGSIASHASRVGQAVHNALYQKLDLPFAYVAFGSEDTAGAIAAMRALGIRGLSVSMPHKERIMSYLDSIDPLARDIGAVNTVVNDAGTLTGYNFDWLGAMLAIEETGVTIEGKRAVVLGAGGAARAVAFGFKERGARHVTILNRTAARGEKLASELDVEYGGDLGALSASYDILAHATSAGHLSQPELCVVPDDKIVSGSVVFDVVCEPLPTPLQGRAEAAGCVVVPGYRMRLHQAAAQFELYTGHKPPLDLMDRVLREAMGL